MKETMKYLPNQYQLREFVVTRMLAIIENTKHCKKGGTIFFGDSITEMCDIEKWYPEITIKYNSGIAGITASMLLHFIDEGVIKYQPSQVVIMVGTNDLGDTEMKSPRDIALTIKEMAEIVHYNCPDCNIYLVSPIPCLEKEHGYKALKKGIRSNDFLKAIFREMKKVIPYPYVTFINAYPALCNKKGEPIEEYYVDGLHITSAGYQVFSDIIKEKIL